MRLLDLIVSLAGIRVRGSLDIEVAGITDDSRQVQPGFLFTAVRGLEADGHRFIGDALRLGACAVVGEDREALASCPPEVTAIHTSDSPQLLPALAARFYGHPSRKLRMVGVTGTNGKTTTSIMVRNCLGAAGGRPGLIGTLGAEIGGEPLPSSLTTPKAHALQELLAEMLRRGADAVSMEVSSHALALRRTDHIAFDTAVFTNLTQDHLDFHRDFEDYYQAKRRLFTDYAAASPKPFSAVINRDAPYGRRLLSESFGKTMSYGLEEANVSARDIKVDASGAAFTVCYGGLAAFPVRLRVGGMFNVYNALAAAAACRALGLPTSAVREGLERTAVPGRFEPVSTGKDFSILVDYAHTPDGLENVLKSARQIAPNRLIAVFGCGGDRDRTKRPLMGRIAAERADCAVVTSDNPRTEDPGTIIAEILTGIPESRRPAVRVEPDRRQAIALAIEMAAPGDVIVIAGKGHEDYQIIGTTRHPFDDRQAARELLEQCCD
ncbi:MAG: UDP-N-acetylmuramoyl-L-alanyl-D-glutamate--2,6-diaminopimelate ligase [Armatimonadetes bacterium]|nr:UDP-N-acetylmuramoyl-L-alanyl-D-glutamate--2,6-diaminopimelate ligase [Armatimonadota bacterium]